MQRALFWQLGWVALFGILNCGPTWAAPAGSVYQILVESDRTEDESQNILAKMVSLGGRPPGDKKILTGSGTNYLYDALMSESNYGRLAEFLRSYGPLKVIRRNEPSGGAVGEIRVILTVVLRGGKAAETAESSRRPPGFSIPMKFDLNRNGITVSEPQWVYDVRDPKAFLINGDQMVPEDFVLLGSTADQVNFTLRFEWPIRFIKRPHLVLRDHENKELTRWEPESLQVFDILGAQDVASGRPSSPSSVAPGATENRGAGRVFYEAKMIAGGDIEALQNAKFFRACWIVEKYAERQEYCSEPLMWSQKDLKNLVVKMAKNSSAPAAAIDGKKAAPQGNIIFKEMRKPRRLTLNLGGGSRLELSGQRPEIKVEDVVGTSGSEGVLVSGTGWIPDGATLDKENEGTWRVLISSQEGIIKVRSEAQVSYAVVVKMDQSPPTERDRPYLMPNGRESGTYLDSVELVGVAPKGTELSAGGDAVKQKGNGFRWRFNLGARGYDHKNYLTVKRGEKSYLTYHEVHRGFPFEMSVRLTGVLTSFQSLLFLGEFAGGVWLESLFGWKHKYLSDRRWGAGGNYFQSINTAQLDLTALNSNLKYRLSRGLWNKDETWGLIAGFSDVKYRGVQARFGGVGFLWARTMPRIFDDLFNIIPLFRFPKWVDMEGIYYPISLMPGVNSQGTFSMTFHGKMFFLPEFFMEAGFGIKRYAFSSSQAQKDLATTMIFGTGGFGYNF